MVTFQARQHLSNCSMYSYHPSLIDGFQNFVPWLSNKWIKMCRIILFYYPKSSKCMAPSCRKPKIQIWYRYYLVQQTGPKQMAQYCQSPKIQIWSEFKYDPQGRIQYITSMVISYMFEYITTWSKSGIRQWIQWFNQHKCLWFKSTIKFVYFKCLWSTIAFNCLSFPKYI